MHPGPATRIPALWGLKRIRNWTCARCGERFVMRRQPPVLIKSGFPIRDYCRACADRVT